MTTIPPPVRWGIIGVGNVAEVKSGPAFYKCKKSSLVAVMRRTKDKAKDFAERHNVPRYYSSVGEFLKDTEIDCVYVATPPGGDRIAIANAIVKAGKPCYMEKPLGRDGNEAREIASLFSNANLPLYVAYYRRSMPKYVKCHKVLSQGALGQLTSVTVTLNWPKHNEDKDQWRYNRPMSGGGLILDVGVHMLDLVDHLLGPIEDCTGVAVRTVTDQGWVEDKERLEDNIRGFWTHRLCHDANEYKMLGSCSFNFCSGGPVMDRVEICGKNGSLSFSVLDVTSPSVLSLIGEKDQFLETEIPIHVHQPMVQDIVNTLTNDVQIQNSYLCTGKMAVRTSNVVDKLLNDRKGWKDDYV